MCKEIKEERFREKWANIEKLQNTDVAGMRKMIIKK